MEFVLAGLQWQTCLVYLDDVIVYGQDFDKHLERVGEVFKWFRLVGLKLKPSKCFLLRPRVPYLGHVISAEGVSTDPAKIEAVKLASTIESDRCQKFPGLSILLPEIYPELC